MEVTNPTSVEIRTWAYSEDEWPHDEWDLFLSWKQEVELFIEFATDHKCPKRIFFLHMLYYLVGYTYGQPRNTDKLIRIENYSEKGSGMNHGDIRLWRKRISELLDGKLKYNYDDWRGGLYAGYKFT